MKWVCYEVAAAGEEPEFTENASDGVNEQTLSSSILNRVKKSGTLVLCKALCYDDRRSFFTFVKKLLSYLELYT